MLKTLITLLLTMLLSGCAAWTTPSTYSNHNTPGGNVVLAQGRAAQYAAAANASYNCPSCTGGVPTGVNQGTGYNNLHTSGLQPAAQDEFIDQVVRDFYNNLRYAISRKTTELFYD